MDKAKRPHAQSSQSRKRAKQSRRIATARTESGRSRKNKSNPSPARASTLPQLDCPNRVAEPLNGVLLLNKHAHSPQWPPHAYWADLNLILSVDYGRNSFDVIKNRWGRCVENLRLDLLATFLFHPEIDDARELNLLRIDHNNLFATREPEQ